MQFEYNFNELSSNSDYPNTAVNTQCTYVTYKTSRLMQFNKVECFRSYKQETMSMESNDEISYIIPGFNYEKM